VQVQREGVKYCGREGINQLFSVDSGRSEGRGLFCDDSSGLCMVGEDERMTLRRLVVCVSVVAAVPGLSACSSGRPSGLAPFTPSATSTSSTPTPTNTSKWTPEQQQVIDGYDRYSELVAALLTKIEKVDLAKARHVATEPYATTFLKDIDSTLSAGFVQTGKALNTISAVTSRGKRATIMTCLDLTHTKLTKQAAPPAQNPPPSQATVSLVREGGSWLVEGLKADEGACVSG